MRDIWRNPEAYSGIIIDTESLLLYPKGVQRLLGIGATKFYKIVKEPTFPKPRILQNGRSVYIRSEIEEWVKNLPVDYKLIAYKVKK
jgi:predicted DNA-binding transcriptional regulator AlpA